MVSFTRMDSIGRICFWHGWGWGFLIGAIIGGLITHFI
jgi:hypothetical protein